MHGHFGYDVSETMSAIRALFAKHRAKLGPTGCEPIPPEKDDIRTYLTVEQIIKAKKMVDEGHHPSTIANETKMSITSAFSIAKKRRRFADLPDDEDAIPAWFAKKQSKYHPHHLR